MNVGELLFERLWAADWRAMDDFLQGLDREGLELARKALGSIPSTEWPMPSQTPPPSDADANAGAGAGDGAGDVVLSGLWREIDPAEEEPARFATLKGGQVVADALMAAKGARSSIDTPALDLLMRWAWVDRSGLEDWLRDFVSRPEKMREAFHFASTLSRWTWGELDQARRHTMVDRVHHFFDAAVDADATSPRGPFPGDEPQSVDFLYSSPIDGFLALLAQESLTRAGEVPYLLSCPSRVDGTVTLSDLVARIKEYGGVAAGPLDLFQTLLRLEPVSPDRLGELEGLELALWSDGHPAERAQGSRDGIELVRHWIRDGGLPSLEVGFDTGRPTLQASPWPAVVSAFPQVPTALLGEFGWVEAVSYEVSGGFRGHWRGRDRREAILAFPSWSDLFAVDVEPLMSAEREQQVIIGQVMAMTGPAGRGRHHLVVSALNAKTLERRLEAVDAAVNLIASGRWHAQAHADVTVAYLHADRLGLARSASSWHLLALAGELKAIWPTILAVLDAGAVMPRKPVGFPEVLAVARKLIRAVPDPTLPQSVHDLAAAKGRTRTHLEARALVGEVR